MVGDNGIWIILIMAAVVGVLLVTFRIVDAMLKSSKPKPKAKEEKSPDVKSAPAVPPDSAQEIKDIKEVKETVTVRSTRSLADEIEKIIKEEKEEKKSQAQTSDGHYHPPTDRIRAYDRIRKYRESRNYIEYDRSEGGITGAAENERRQQNSAEDDLYDEDGRPVYSREEYKKMMALLSKPVSDA